MKIIECPRDAMQGVKDFIPTELKIRYINELLKVGFDTIDFGSFVSPRAIPQMHDTAEVLAGLDMNQARSRLLAIVANVRGASEACEFEEISYLGYPLSLSETFQQQNTNRAIDQALDDLAEIQEICQSEEKTLVTYLSMGFGNPYGDPYEIDYVEEFVERLNDVEVEIISLADTIGMAEPVLIKSVFENLIPKFPHIEFGAHLHSRATSASGKVEAAYLAGCRRIDGTIRGFGGCPMASDKLVGNIPTETILTTCSNLQHDLGLDQEAFERSVSLSNEVFL